MILLLRILGVVGRSTAIRVGVLVAAADHGAAYLTENAVGRIDAAAGGTALHTAVVLRITISSATHIAIFLLAVVGRLMVGFVGINVVFPCNSFGVVIFQPAAAVLLIAFTVMGGAAYGADNNVIAIGKWFMTNGTFISDIVQKIISEHVILPYYIRNDRPIQIRIMSQT